MQRASSFGAALALGAILLATSPSRADERVPDERAAHLFDEADTAFRDGQYRRAATLFEEAYALAPHPATLINAAQARARAGDLAAAANHYAHVIAEAPSAADRDEANTALTALAPDLGRVVVSGDDAVVDRARVVIERPLWVMPGKHVVEGHVAGHAANATVEVERGRVVHVRLSAEPEATASRLPRYAAYGLGAATALAGGFALASGLEVLDQKRTFDRTFADADLDSGLAEQRRTNVLLGVTIGLAVLTGAATVWALTAGPSHR
jgi:hypothetical protein